MADSNFYNRLLLVDFDGADAATAATDASRFGRTLTFNGDAQLDTAQKAYGTASLLLDGTGDYVSIPIDESLQFHRDVWCVEFEYREPTDPGADFTFIGQWDDGVSEKVWRIYWDSAGNRISLEFSNNGVANTDTAHFDFDTDAAGALDLFDGSFHHIAVYRVISGEIYVAVDGNVGATDTGAANEFIDLKTATPLTIGCHLTSGVAAGLATGWFDALRITRGIEEYNATTGTFTAPSAAHDKVDAGEGAAYSYPLTVNLHNTTGATASRYPWETVQSTGELAMGVVRDSTGGPTPRTDANYCFAYGDTTSNMGPANLTAAIGKLDIDLSRYDADFLTDIDAGELEFNFAGWVLVEATGDGKCMWTLEFLDGSGNLLAAKSTDHFEPSVGLTWEQLALDAVRIPASTRTVRIKTRGSKYTGVFADQRMFFCDFTATIDQTPAYATDPHTLTYFANPADMVTDWNSAGTGLVEQDVYETTGSYIGSWAIDGTSLGTNVDCDSGIINLQSDTTDIDAGSVDYELTAIMCNDVDTCSMWIEFYEADGTTIVGTRVSSAAATRDAKGELVTVSGTIPATAEKAIIGFNTDTGASGSDFHATEVMMMETGPAAGGGGGGGDGSSAALTIIMV